MQFKKAQRQKAKLRLALTGPSGSGKTLGALMIAKGLGGRIAVIDTEHGSASLYADSVVLTGGKKWQPPEFDVLEIDAPYKPEVYCEAIKSAVKAGYQILIIDSITHEWNGAGGCLELVDELAKAKFKGNTWSAWSEVTPRHRDFLDLITSANVHIIATIRSKTETSQVAENGKKRVVKLGMKSETRDGGEYEFTTVLDIVHDGHFAVATKDRTGLFMSDPKPISEATGELLMKWLNSGAVVVEGEVVGETKPKPLASKSFEALCSMLEAATTIVELEAAGQMIAQNASTLSNDQKNDLRLRYAKKKTDITAPKQLEPSSHAPNTTPDPWEDSQGFGNPESEGTSPEF